MARGKRKNEKVSAAPQGVPVEVAPAEPRYPLEIWIENAPAMLSTTRYALVGALYGVTEPEGGFTKTELKALLDSFSNRPLV